MEKTGPLEIIDLTEPSPPPEIIVLDSEDDSDEVVVVTPNNTGREHRKKRIRRKKRKTKVTSLEDGEVIESSLPASRDRSEERDTDRKEDPALRLDRRSRSPEPHPKSLSPQRKSLSPQPRGDFVDLFFVDVKPAPLPDFAKLNEPRDTSSKSAMLLLPSHVTIFKLGEGEEEAGGMDIIKPPTLEPAEDRDFIEYLDYDDQQKVRYCGSSGIMSALNELLKDGIRYFKTTDEDTKPTRFVCKNCGVEGKHKTFECPIQIVRIFLVHINYPLPLAQYIYEVFDLRCTKRAFDSSLSN